jgi:putative membrane protein
MIDTTQPLTGPTPRAFVVANTLATAAVMTFLVWLIYFNRGTDSATASSSTLPAINAVLNGSSAILIAAALAAAKCRRYRIHASLMLAALGTSACFLCTYIYYHLHHGDSRFLGTGWIRPVYFTVLVSHIGLSMIAFPMIVTSIFLAVTRRFKTHRKVSRYTWAAWMYVSISGVAVYFLLH